MRGIAGVFRDPLGIKPLYCGNGKEVFYFTPEAKALAALTEDMYQFPPGCWYHSRQGWHAYYERCHLR